MKPPLETRQKLGLPIAPTRQNRRRRKPRTLWPWATMLFLFVVAWLVSLL